MQSLWVRVNQFSHLNFGVFYLYSHKNIQTLSFREFQWELDLDSETLRSWAKIDWSLDILIISSNLFKAPFPAEEKQLMQRDGVLLVIFTLTLIGIMAKVNHNIIPHGFESLVHFSQAWMFIFICSLKKTSFMPLSSIAQT